MNLLIIKNRTIRPSTRDANSAYRVKVVNANPNDILIPIKLDNGALASSGNYRQFYEEDSLTFAHIINPMTGIAQPTDILSATVLADDCETADAFATAFMAMGLQKSKVLANEINQIKTCLVYYDSKVDSLSYFYSNGFEQQLK